MSLLSGKLSGSSGLGGPPSGGAFSTSTYGMGSQMAPAQSTGIGTFRTLGTGFGDVRQGKVTLAVLESLVILLVLFYVWTHAVQGGG